MRPKVALGLLLVALALAPSAQAAPAMHEVLVVGNNWEGTADVVDPRTFQRLRRLNIIPDAQERMAEILANPVDAGYFTGINLLIGEGNNQYVDDAFTSHDGRYLYVSRPSFKDVIGLDLATRRIVWRFEVDGNRADHMAISPDGKVVLVSASTGNVVHAIDTATGKEVGRFASGDSPHENNYSLDGSRVFHASIGFVYTPTDDPSADTTKGARYFQIVDGRTYKILRRVDIGERLADVGHPEMSSAVRPMAITPDEKRIYMQISFLHGFIEYDVARDKVLRIANLPISEEAAKLPREQYLLDSAHHGIAIDSAGKKLCVAGTMSDYAAIVSRATFATKIAAHGGKPYWSTNSSDGKLCFISFSGDDRVSVVDYAKEKEIASIRVGNHPQRMRVGTVRCAYLGPRVDCVPPRVTGAKVLRRKPGVGRRLRLRLSEKASLRIVVARRKNGKWRRVRALSRSAKKGVNRFRLGKLRKRGRHRVRIRATDAAGNVSKRRTVRFSAAALGTAG